MSACPPGRATASALPHHSGSSSSHTDTSNVYGVFCTTTSPPSSPNRPRCHRSCADTARCSSTTPFGRPVLPDVNST